MSILSDIKDVFAGANSTSYYLSFYPDPTQGRFEIYGVMQQVFDQQNSVATKPLEQSNFTSDSVQIKAEMVTIRGVILPPSNLNITTAQAVNDYIAGQYRILKNYLNGIQLFTLYNALFSYGIWQPLKLFGLNMIIDLDTTLPIITFSFMQMQTTTAINYSTVNVTSSGITEPMNEPVRTVQG